jgi:DNA-binding MarR family transcriptional regulator
MSSPPQYQLLTPWRHEALQLMSDLERTAKRLTASRRALGAWFGLTIAAWRALTCLVRSRYTLSQADFARQLRLSRPVAHRLVGRLEKAGWLCIEASRADRRVRLLSLTPLGRHTLADANATLERLLREIANDLDPGTMRETAATLQHLGDRLWNCRSALRRTPRPHRGARSADTGNSFAPRRARSEATHRGTR